MSRKNFTDEEILILRQNPFTYNVTYNSLSFTKEFKELFWEEYNKGKIPRQILIDNGYNPEILGDKRIWGIAQLIRYQYGKYGEFREGSSNKKTPTRSKQMSENDELKQLRQEVDYMKQEIEFLKKISSIRTTGK